MKTNLDQDIIFGVTTSAHQVEGGDVNTDWWDFEQRLGRIKNGDQSAGAVDFWTRFREDVALMAEHRIQSHRISISWGRVEPEENHFDEAALDRYAEIVDAHRDAGILVAVTLLHFALPRWLASRGGILARDAAPAFRRFARRVAHRLRGRVWQWHTINEPIVLADGAYRRGVWPPNERSIGKFVIATRALLGLHVEGYRGVHEVDDAPAGLVHNFISLRARHESSLDRQAAQVARWCLTDSTVGSLVTGRLAPPWGRGERMDGLASSSDIIGVNYYNGVTACVHERPAFMDGTSGVRRTQMDWSAWAPGLVDVLQSASKAGVPVFVTENGIATDDDTWRSSFLVDHLQQLAAARRMGIDVRGYSHWSWIDNFEWAEGFAPHFGLVGVDAQTLQRRPRQSLRLYSQIIRDRVLL